VKIVVPRIIILIRSNALSRTSVLFGPTLISATYLTVGILSFYKAQVAKLKAAYYRLPGIQVVDGNELISLISVKTVDVSQGTEYDIVLISLVQDCNISFLSERYCLYIALICARYIEGIYYNYNLT
jgi:hypothetical protein